MENLLNLANERVKNYRKYFRLMWWSHMWLSSLSIIISVLIPFGLALLLYFPDNAKTINILLIALSATGVVFGIVSHVARLSERAKRHKELYVTLENSIALFNDGMLSEADLRQSVEYSSKKHIDEESS